MTEKQKRDSGLLYDANLDATLLKERETCKRLCRAFNRTRPGRDKRQQRLLRRLLGTAGQGICIMAPFWCDYGYNIFVGDGFYANHGCVILDEAPVRFGKNVFIGPMCGFYTAAHPMDAQERAKGLETAAPITVGDDVWIGGGVTVLPGVHIGEGAVIGAGSVVIRDIPAFAVAAGNPCRVIRMLK